VALTPQVIGPESADTVRLVLLIIGVDLALAFPTKAFAGIVQAKLRYDLLLILDLVTFAFTVIGTVWALTHGYGVLALAIVTGVVGMLHSGLYMALVKYLFPPLRIDWRHFDAASGRQLASYSVWSFLIQTANQMRFRIHSLTTGALFGGEAVTQFAIGARLVEYAQTPLVQVSNVAMPVLTRLHATEEGEHTSRVVLFLLRLGLVVAVYAAGLVIFLGGPFITRWMGPDHEVSPQIAALLSIGFMTEVFLMPLTNWLFAAAKLRMLAVANVTEAITNITLSIILGKMFGLIGIAMGTVLPLLVVQVFWVAPYACKMLNISFRQFAMLIIPGVVAATVFLGSALSLRSIAANNGYVGLLCAGTLITLVYWPTVLLTCLGKHDRGFIWRAIAVPAAQ
jgi:O-antigen/teichoic acid export membrane protein